MARRRYHFRSSYLLALGAVALMSIGAQLGIQQALKAAEKEAGVINVAGRQRMLSQRIAKASLGIENGAPGESGARSARLRGELEIAATRLGESHAELLGSALSTEEIREALRGLEPSIQPLIRVQSQPAIDVVLAAEAEFLPKMDAIVDMYQAAADLRVARLQRVELGLMALTLVVLVLEALLVFEPLRRRLLRSIEELDESRQEAEAALGAKGDFMDAMSHELRTPLNGVIGALDLVGQNSLAGSDRGHVQTAKASAITLDALLRDVLDYSDLVSSRGKVVLEEAPFRLDELMIELAYQAAGMISTADPEVVLDLESTAPTWAHGDSRRLKQLLLTLVSNAVKFTESGHVVLRARRVRGQVIVQVRDSGIGMSPEVVSSALQAFTQAESGMDRRYGGAGLGLTLAGLLVQKMGGELQIESSPGEGSSVTVTLPMPEPVALDSLTSHGQPGPASRLDGRVIDLVHVESPARDVLCRWLEAQGATVVDGDSWAGDGLDLQLVAAEQVEGASGPCPRVVLGGSGAPPAGYVARVTRPYRPGDFHSAVLRALTDDGPPSEASLAGVRVLVAEDNPVNRRILGAQLRGFGCQVTLVEDGREAVQTYRAADFDVVLLDLQMPVLDGFQAAREILGDSEADSVCVISVSANDLPEDAARSREAGFRFHLGKPLTRVQLADALRRALA